MDRFPALGRRSRYFDRVFVFQADSSIVHISDHIPQLMLGGHRVSFFSNVSVPPPKAMAFCGSVIAWYIKSTVEGAIWDSTLSDLSNRLNDAVQVVATGVSGEGSSRGPLCCTRSRIHPTEWRPQTSCCCLSHCLSERGRQSPHQLGGLRL